MTRMEEISLLEEIPLRTGTMHTLEVPVLLGDRMFTEVMCLARMGWSANEFIVVGKPMGSDVAVKFVIIYNLRTMQPFAVDLVHGLRDLRIVA